MSEYRQMNRILFATAGLGAVPTSTVIRPGQTTAVNCRSAGQITKVTCANKYSMSGLDGCGCGCKSCSCKGTGEILGQSPGSLAIGVVLFALGAAFLYHTFKNLDKPQPSGWRSSMAGM